MRQRVAAMDADSPAAGLDLARFMGLALAEARRGAEENSEVPVACILVDPRDGAVLAASHNGTNVRRNATRHCELEAIDAYLGVSGDWHTPPLVDAARLERLRHAVLFVTCEPCVMCAAALRIAGVREVVYAAPNDKFGGCGSVLDAATRDAQAGSGVVAAACDLGPPLRCMQFEPAKAEAVGLLRDFYAKGNPRAPDTKRQRPLMAEEG